MATLKNISASYKNFIREAKTVYLFFYYNIVINRFDKH